MTVESTTYGPVAGGALAGTVPHDRWQIGEWIAEVLRGLAKTPGGDAALEARVRGEVARLCDRFPIYPDRGEG